MTKRNPPHSSFVLANTKPYFSSKDPDLTQITGINTQHIVSITPHGFDGYSVIRMVDKQQFIINDTVIRTVSNLLKI